ncbi:penicillin-binding protein 1A [Rhodoferax sp. BAB1]|uniref:penicillin-binding protein 1A n=1 Tax=Rhodoferax sp. BAB1 TaxID=2741720 RepID=UPI001576ADE0|nr:penicillin-binding protein 1A [Rhodoferax sp. BAB1]
MPPDPQPESAPSSSPAGMKYIQSAALRRFLRIGLWAGGVGLAGLVSILIAVSIAMALAYPNLPDISDLSEYRPKLPLRIFSTEGDLIGEFGEERRNFTPIKDIPQALTDAVLAIEDARFFQHGGVDYVGVVRAGLANVGKAKSQGASTITMQVARNVYLSSEKTFTRKIYEILLTFKLEHLLTKDQILEIYMNQIYLGNRAYGFAAAAETYFGKALKDITIAEAAMLAGLPKAPSAYNPISNPKRARSRQLYIIDRMLDNGFITAEEAETARTQELRVKTGGNHAGGGNAPTRSHAEFVAEMVRQMIFAQYGEETYTRGLNVYTTIRSSDQEVAYQALRQGIMEFERRQAYRGPEKFITLPQKADELEDAIDDALDEHPDNGDLLAAVVLEANPRKVVATRRGGEILEITGEGLRIAQPGLQPRAGPKLKIRRGAIIRIMKTQKNTWEILQLPEVEGAFVSLDPRNGAIKALVGGFDFEKNKYNHVTQAWRQPGSSFKPFIYSAALEKGFTPATVVNDAPLFFEPELTGGQPWEPKNYDGAFEGPMPLRRGMAKSKNMISIRILDAIGARYAQEWIAQFGFEPEKHPPYLTMALGAGSVTPMQLATGYSVFANGGYRINPWLISKITEQKGKTLIQTKPPVPDESMRAVDARNAFVISTLLQEVMRTGTGARAQATLKRPDIYGKTGTTNDSMDAWFAGYHPTLTAVTWIGYDTPRKLGDRETGGGLSLPVWISYMEHALRDVPTLELAPPEGVVHAGIDWLYAEHAKDGGVLSLGLDDMPAVMPPPGGVLPPPATVPAPMPVPAPAPVAPSPGAPASAPVGEERLRILDLFRN